MSSLVKEDLEKKLFKPLSQNLYEFIEIEFSVQDRYYLCVSGNLFFLLSFQNVNFSLLYGSTLTSIPDYWKNHSFNYTFSPSVCYDGTRCHGLCFLNVEY